MQDGNWEQFVEEHILKFGVTDGILLITKRAKSVYAQGSLDSVSENCMPQFVQIFNGSTEEQEEKLCSKGFDLQDHQGKQNHFTIYHKTYCSIYSTSESNNQGLVVCNLPYGVLIASYPSNQTSTDAVRVLENACGILRT